MPSGTPGRTSNTKRHAQETNPPTCSASATFVTFASKQPRGSGLRGSRSPLPQTAQMGCPSDSCVPGLRGQAAGGSRGQPAADCAGARAAGGRQQVPGASPPHAAPRRASTQQTMNFPPGQPLGPSAHRPHAAGRQQGECARRADARSGTQIASRTPAVPTHWVGLPLVAAHQRLNALQVRHRGLVAAEDGGAADPKGPGSRRGGGG